MMKRSFLCAAFLLMVTTRGFSADERKHYAIAILPTPVFNTPDIAGQFGGQNGNALPTDKCGQLRAVEYVALPATPFRIEGTIRKGTSVVYRVTTNDYPYPTTSGYFIDSRFVRTTDAKRPGRPRNLPAKSAIISDLLAAQGSAYVWGGNIRGGIPDLSIFFPPPPHAPLDPKTDHLRQLKGVDCSGLLYEATGGFTPRNTSALVAFGMPVPVAGMEAAEIVRRLEPLDLIAWSGHVLIVLDRERVIESRLDCTGRQGGVTVRPLRAALEEIMKRRVPLNSYQGKTVGRKKCFVVRRWYGPAAAAPLRPASSMQE